MFTELSLADGSGRNMFYSPYWDYLSLEQPQIVVRGGILADEM